jgi:hypothetical protein
LKGFRFAEFEYRYTSERFYGDVDILYQAQDATQIKTAALALGWAILYDSLEFDLQQPHAMILQSPDRKLCVEMHKYVLQSASPLSQKLSKAFWDSSESLTWYHYPIRQLQPVDAVLCMYLNRAWGDYFGRKVHDILDVQVMIQKYGLTRQQLVARANELGAGLALRVAMRTCDPWRDVLRLGNRSRLEVWWDIVSAFPNWRSYDWDMFWKRVGKVSVLWEEIFEGWKLIRLAKQNLKQQTDLEKILLEMTPEVEKSGQDIQIRTLRLERGVRWALRLTNQHVNACVPRSLALFHALRKEGLEVSFVSGVRRNGGKLEGHAWLELNGKPIPGLGDENSPNVFKENFRYPKP